MSDTAATSTDSANASSWTFWWKFLWALYVVGFVFVGGLGLRELRNRVHVVDSGPQSSTDTVFLKTLRVENASAQIADCLRDIPAGEAVAVVYQNPAISEFDALLIGSIAWPHPVPHVALKEGEALENSRLVEAKATRAVFFLGMPKPTASEHVRSLSPLMHFYRSPNLPPAR